MLLVDDVVLGGFAPTAFDELVLVGYWRPEVVADVVIAGTLVPGWMLTFG